MNIDFYGAYRLKHQLNTLMDLSEWAKARFIRLPILISGNQIERNQLLEQFLNQSIQTNVAWISDSTPDTYENLKHLKAGNVIGKEHQLIIYDIYTDFDPNLFAALSGTLKGGGLFIILSPPLNAWKEELKTNGDWYTWRFVSKLSANKLCLKMNLSDEISDTPPKLSESIEFDTFTEQQQQAINEIIHVVKGHRNRPLVLLADRGRGKSAALGIAAGKLLQSGLKLIIITAPSLDACGIVFKHIKLELPDATIKPGKIETSNGCILFVAPDKLSHSTPKADLLIIDEAAGIPSSMLEIFVANYSRIVFASTIHGYEGSGHCFSIKFFKHLDKLTPGWKKQTLTHPARWASNDPLEELTNELFLLKPLSLTTSNAPNIDANNINIQQISQQTLVKNDDKLNRLYELISTAHYRTQPSDLLTVLNNPDIKLFLMISDKHVIGAAFSIKEGNLSKDIDKEIWLGHRRPKGHIIPQTLTMHLGIKGATQFNYLRVMRIAIHPALQNRSLGSKLLQHLEKFAQSEKFDAIGCTFASTEKLINFWGKHDFSLIRLGHHQKAKSNGYAALMLKGISDTCSNVIQRSKHHFHNNFPYQLRETHQTLEHQTIIAIFKHAEILTTPLITNNDREDLESYVCGNRQYEDNLSALYKFTHHSLLQPATFKNLNQQQLEILVLKILQQRSWQDVSTELKLTGKKESAELLKNSISVLLKDQQF